MCYISFWRGIFLFHFYILSTFFSGVGEGFASFDDGIRVYVRAVSCNVLVGQVWRMRGGDNPFQFFGEVILVRKQSQLYNVRNEEMKYF